MAERIRSKPSGTYGRLPLGFSLIKDRGLVWESGKDTRNSRRLEVIRSGPMSAGSLRPRCVGRCSVVLQPFA
jgi:hypothetical protein